MRRPIGFFYRTLLFFSRTCVTSLDVSAVICPIATAYSMGVGQIIKSDCVCQSVSVSVCPSVSTLMVAFLDRFLPKLAQT